MSSVFQGNHPRPTAVQPSNLAPQPSGPNKNESGTQEIRKRDLGHMDLSGQVIAAALEVHRALGPGFLESVYENALCIELDLRGIGYERQKPVPLFYRDRLIGEHRLDLLIEKTLIIELKAVKTLEDIFFSTVRSYMKAAGLEDGLILNFATMPLTIKRVGRELRNPPNE